MDVLFVNAGIARFLPVENVTPQLFDEQFNVNVRGAYLLVHCEAQSTGCGFRCEPESRTVYPI